MRWKHGILGLAGLAFLAAFPWGPLFAWSPVHPGYRVERFSRADVLYPAGMELDPAYCDVDRYVAVAESFHELKCSKRIKVVVCRNWSDCLRFAPFLGKRRPFAVTIPTGTVIFVTPAVGDWADIGGLLRHELSHAVLNQNRSLISVWRMLRQPWVGEGVATVIGGMGTPAPGRHFISLATPEFLSRAKTEDMWRSFPAAQKDWRFGYTAWMYFWNRQIERNGQATFLKFERACSADPRRCQTIFGNVYGTDLRAAVGEFQAEVRSGRLAPPQVSF